MRKIDKSRLEALSIYELRNAARFVGVPRPTTMQRATLLNEITKRVEDENFTVRPVITPGVRGRGRPPKVASTPVEAIMEKEDTCASSVMSLVEKLHTTGLDLATLCASGDTISNLNIIGNVCVMPRGTAILITPALATINITSKMVAENQLKSGDRLQVKVQNGDITEIVSIDRAMFDVTKHVKPYITTKLGKHDIKFGGRYTLFSRKPVDFSEFAVQNRNPEAFTIALFIDAGDDVVDYLRENGMNEVFAVRVNTVLKKRLLMTINAVYEAKYQASQGKHVVLYVDNINRLYKLYNSNSAEQGTYNITKPAIDNLTDLKTFFTESRQLSTGGSLTIVTAMYEPLTEIEKFVIDDLRLLANATWTE